MKSRRRDPTASTWARRSLADLLTTTFCFLGVVSAAPAARHPGDNLDCPQASISFSTTDKPYGSVPVDTFAVTRRHNVHRLVSAAVRLGAEMSRSSTAQSRGMPAYPTVRACKQYGAFSNWRISCVAGRANRVLACGGCSWRSPMRAGAASPIRCPSASSSACGR